ncbi:oxidoreductase, aldo/keto reductase family protein [Cooperia oncophora]
MKYSDVDYLTTWKVLEDFVKEGKIRSIGVSNFNHKQIERIIDNCTIKPAVLQRENIFITSKVWNTFHSAQACEEHVNEILNQLQLEYIDLMLIHWPHGYEEGGEPFPKRPDSDKMKYSDVDYLTTWKVLEDFVKEGKKKLREFCKEHDIAVTAYSSLSNPGSAFFRKAGDPNLLTEPVIKKIAAAHNKVSGGALNQLFDFVFSVSCQSLAHFRHFPLQYVSPCNDLSELLE